jgi:hypothetical protein
MLVAPSAIETATETSTMPRSNGGDAFFFRSAAPGRRTVPSGRRPCGAGSTRLCQRGDRTVGQVAKDFDLTETAMSGVHVARRLQWSCPQLVNELGIKQGWGHGRGEKPRTGPVGAVTLTVRS